MLQITFHKMHIFNNWILRILILSFLSIVSFADEHIDPYLTAAITSEPSSIVGGCINAVTGDFVFASTDLIATGEEPSSLNHLYTSRLRKTNLQGGLLTGEHLFIRCYNNKEFVIKEPSGIELIYYMPSYKIVNTKGVKEHLNRDQILQLSPESIKSLSNSSDFKVSGRTNPRNNLVKYNQKNGTLIIHSPDGSRRHYSSELNRILVKKKDKVAEKEFKFHEEFYKLFREEKIDKFFFKLDKELLSNGNWIFYAYNDLYWPVEIKVTNPSMKKTYSRINVISSIGNDITCKTSCNKFLKIHGEANFQYFDNHIFDWDKKAKKWEKRDIKQIISYTYRGKIPPEAPQENYKLLDYDGKVIQDCILPDKRQLHIDYYTAGDHSVNNTTINIPNTQDSRFMRVKSISITGKDGDLQNLYYFIYHPGVIDQSGGSTEV